MWLTDVDLGKRQPAAKKSHWDMRSKATPEQLVSFFETVIEKSPSNLKDDVTKVIQVYISFFDAVRSFLLVYASRCESQCGGMLLRT